MSFFISDVPMSCINQAAYEYHVSAKVIIAVLNVEGGKVGLAHRNKNGTYDLGPLQINTSWWPTLYHYEITPSDVLFNPCINVRVGTWILGKSIAKSKNLLIGIGNYHSMTPLYNQQYSQKVRVSYTQLKLIEN